MSGAAPADLTPEQAEVAAVITSLYEALGDRPRFDAHLAPDVVMWESDAPELMRGLAALDALRDERARRSAGGPAPAWVRPEILAVDRWGDVAVVRYLLRAHFGRNRPDDVFRVTDVLRRDGRWRIAHHHAEKYAR